MIKILKKYWKQIRLTGILSIFAIVDYLIEWKILGFLKGVFLNHFQLSINFLFFCWLLILSYFLIIYRKQLSEVKGDFIDDFKYGLKKWESESGEISIESGNELSVTKCSHGILTKNGQNWRNYIFEFETKIIKKCSSWIVRAKDFNNYVMFQFDGSGIIPHYRIQGGWDVLKRKQIRLVVNNNEWFKVKIEINGDVAIISIKDIEIYHEKIFSNNPEDKEVRYISFPNGRVGFREYGSEHAYFRNIKVLTIP